MKKIIFIGIIYMISISSFAQIGNDSNFGMEVPKLFPVSPEASDLYNYSIVPVNYTSGQTNVNIPIFTIEQNGFTWPVSLSHHHTGLVLEKGPTRVGLGWTLLASAVINREVRGLPDESPKGIYGVNSIRESIINPYIYNDQPIGQGALENIINNTSDAEPDLYHVSIGKRNFSFKIDNQNNIHLLSKQNFKVDYSLDEITVIDDMGIKYYFADKEISSALGEYDDINGTFGNGHTYPSSWYLSKIRVKNGSYIYFHYDDIMQTENYSFWGSSWYNYVGDWISDPYSHFCGEQYGGRQGFTKTIIDKKILSSISFKKGDINFNHESNGFFQQYNSIVIEDKHNKPVELFDFVYDNSPRPLLTRIDRNLLQHYSFEYYFASNIPDFVNNSQDIPTAMDWWGYYNGETSNASITGVPVGGQGLVKNSSDRHMWAGSLYRITYPTGGTTTFTYEQNEMIGGGFFGMDSEECEDFNRRISFHLTSEPGVNKSNSFTYTFIEPTYARIRHDVQTYAWCHVELQMNKVGECPTGTNFGNYMDTVSYLDVLYDPQGNGSIVHEICPFVNINDVGDGVSAGELSWFRGDSDGCVLITPGTYNFYASINGESQYGKSHVELEIEFFKNVDALGDPIVDQENQYSKVGGMRVKEIVDCGSEDTDTCIKRTFEYGDAIDFDMGTYHYNTLVRKACSYLSGVIIFEFQRTVFNYKSFTNVNFNSGVPIFYKTVKEKFGEVLVPEEIDTNYDFNNDFIPTLNYDGSHIVTFINSTVPSHTETIYKSHSKGGYTTKHFETPNIGNDNSFPFVPQVGDISMSRIKTEEQFKYTSLPSDTDPEYSKVLKTDYLYSQFRDLLDGSGNSLAPGYPLGLKVDRKVVFEGNLLSVPWEEIELYYYLNKYGEVNNRFLPSFQEKTTYYEGSEQISSNNTIYNLDTTVKQKDVPLSENRTKVIKYTYPQDLSSPTAAEQKLVLKNRINTPIKTELVVLDENDDVLSNQTQYSVYSDWGNDIVEPETVQTLKGAPANNTLEDRVHYKFYQDGNLKDTFKVEGTHIVYIWGYNKTLPIAKVENATYSDVETALLGIGSNIDNLQTASNNDDDRTIDTIDIDGSIIPDGQEGLLRQELNSLRSILPNAMVTTYTYDPLIGVTSITDPKGYVTYYEYDEFNRLKRVWDAEGNILSENDYHYKGQ